MRRDDFPPDFVFGSATAAYQVEGAFDEDGRGLSIWDTFSRRPGAVLNGDTGDVASDHYHRFGSDVQLMARLGLDAYRFSISWPRIQPNGRGPRQRAGIGFYRRLAEDLLEHGVQPWATLYHWDLPQELEDAGGWIERDTAERFADYCAGVAEELGDVIPNWITLNEPWCSAFLGYASGVHAPGRKLGSQAARAAHHLLLGHGLATTRLRDVRPDAQVGLTVNLYSVRPATEREGDLDAARRIDGLSNRFFLDPVLLGRYPADVLEDLGETDWFERNADNSDLRTISAPLDFLGVNYYSRHTVAAGDAGDGTSAYPGSEAVRFVPTGAPTTQMGWEIHPDGLLDVLQMVDSRAPGLATFVTENGAAFEDRLQPDGTVDDPDRVRYLRDHLRQAVAAIAEGLPLRGYFAWSLMDNYEWAWGYARRFGLVYVDYATQRRVPKSSALWLSSFLRGAA